jgi:ABC-type Mn2+/Zn2+ transport system ATPase subunit
MLESIRLQNWRGHQNTTVPLAPFTILVGGNGVGKTSVLEALAELARARGLSELVSATRAPEAVVRAGATLAAIEFVQSSGVQAGRLERGSDALQSVVVGADDPREARTIELSLSPRRIAAPSPVKKTVVDCDGFGTASTLAHLKLTSEARYRRILERARVLIPTITDLGMTPAETEEITFMGQSSVGVKTYSTHAVTAYALTVSFDHAPCIPAEAVSEGTLLLIAALTALESRADVRRILIDDLDRALHVEAQAQFVKILRELQTQDPALQIVATTHSPLVVELFEDHEVVVLGRAADGRVIARRLSEHPKRAQVRSLSAGEFWIAELEHWVAA